MNRARVFQLGALMVVLCVVTIVMSLTNPPRLDTAKAAPEPIATTTPSAVRGAQEIASAASEILEEIVTEQSKTAEAEDKLSEAGIQKIEIPEGANPTDVIFDLYTKSAFGDGTDLFLLDETGPPWLATCTHYKQGTAHLQVEMRDRLLPNMGGQMASIYSIGRDGELFCGYVYEGQVVSQTAVGENVTLLVLQDVALSDDQSKYALTGALPDLTSNNFIGRPDATTLMPTGPMIDREVAQVFLKHHGLCGIALDPSVHQGVKGLYLPHTDTTATNLMEPDAWPWRFQLDDGTVVHCFQAHHEPGGNRATVADYETTTGDRGSFPLYSSRGEISHLAWSVATGLTVSSGRPKAP
ncbi:hypothetical protein HY375_00015 [Candidatus Berkelbacteria bacterium]|nr:hypothetical protein [Candidatus Berkelbacteria bacterium]